VTTEPEFVKRLPGYLRAKKKFQSAARVYARRFHEFGDEACDEITLAQAEAALDRASIVLFTACGWTPPADYEGATVTTTEKGRP